MNKFTILVVISCLPLSIQATELVTNGDFSAGSATFGASPTDWNATVGAAGVGQFSPAVSPPLSGQVAYMGTGTQIIQTLSATLAADTTYTISFDYIGSVGDFSGTNTFGGFIGYGTGSGGTSAFSGSIAGGDILSGQNSWNPNISTSGQSYSVSFTTPGTITGSADNLAIVLNPALDGTTGQQVYLDNVSVTAVPEPGTYALLLAVVCATVVCYRRRCCKP